MQIVELAIEIVAGLDGVSYDDLGILGLGRLRLLLDFLQNHRNELAQVLVHGVELHIDLLDQLLNFDCL